MQMNVRSLCLSRVARDVGEPWLWWEYVDKMGDQCSMKDRKFDTDCSEKVSSLAKDRRWTCCCNGQM